MDLRPKPGHGHGNGHARGHRPDAGPGLPPHDGRLPMTGGPIEKLAAAAGSLTAAGLLLLLLTRRRRGTS
ncbi:hypothetical protein HII36_47115 [Nonomuraea sp. NN258]|uniref:hypothetical protein n=1 Tax=Nonomuraea antri TaxID=2730852 RepID=UPI00156874D3|nr:hypothetical protein [Nonomuraea antri]NRQ39345.1 hypothetical protein [Nonomuraea antri]